jgi:hypothetical protein
MTIIVFALLGSWLLICVEAQLRPLARPRARGLSLGLIPSWQFFTNPLGSVDLFLFYRTREQGTFSPWLELPVLTRCNWLEAVWNPQRRMRNVLVEAASNLVSLKVRAKVDSAAIENSLAYRTLLQIVRARIPAIPGNTFQFAVRVRDWPYGSKGVRVLFLSGEHRI